METKPTAMQLNQARRRMYSAYSNMRLMFWKLSLYRCTIEQYTVACEEYRDATEELTRLIERSKNG